MPKKLTLEDFIRRSEILHGKFYDYSLVDYINSQTKVKIICPKHAIFEQQPFSHLQGFKCSKCKTDKSKMNNKSFIEKANIIHNGKYNYDLVNYITNKVKVKIKCKIHGIFEQQPTSHLRGHGCSLCKTQNLLYNKEQYFIEVKEIHKNKYDYLISEYKGIRNKIIIICPIHGNFSQNAGLHLSGQGCPKCAKDSNRSNSKEFIMKVIKIHGNRYDYSLVDYINNKTKVKIICSKHGIFNQVPDSHLNGSNCPKCVNIVSKGEKEVLEYIKTIYKGLIIENDRKIINGKELDIYLPDLKIGIEYNGEYWHDKKEKESPGYHQLKEDLCKEKGITLINVYDSEWNSSKEFIKNNLLNKII